MTLTLLIDLDNTLLANDMDAFLPAYLQALGRHLHAYAEDRRMIATLLDATRRMVANNRPDCTLKEVFDSAFYPALSLDQETIRPILDEFYQEVFPGLQALTRPIPHAREVVEEALRRGYTLAVATNPLFPRTAILQRLAWAGLPASDYPFQVIGSYETFHFAKPNPAYLAECLARLGWPEGPAVMIGDDLQNDIQSAHLLGLPAYHVLPNGDAATGAAGPLEGFLPWLDAAGEEALQADYSQPSAFLAILRSTPAVFDTLCRDLDEPTWTHRPEPQEWSLTEILCHLRDVDQEVNLPRMHKVLQEENPFLPGMVTDPWAEERQYICQNGPEALGPFTAARGKIIDLLESLSPDDWQRSARHAIFGPTSLRELAGIIAGHDRLHVQQVKAALDSISG